MTKKLKVALFLLTISFFFQKAYSQENEGFSRNIDKNLASISSSTSSSLGSAGYFYNPIIPVDGSEYLFDAWENTAFIYTKDKSTFSLKNINLNIKRNSFVSKLGKDSIFTYNMNNIDKIIINRKIYKNIFSEDGKRVYQVIYEDTDFSILKGFSIQAVLGSPNPMVNRKSDRLVRKEVLYLKKDNVIKRFRLGKRRVLDLVNANNKKEVLRYAKDEKLSFRKEEDIHKILEYSSNL
jgi:hypothetical protein